MDDTRYYPEFFNRTRCRIGFTAGVTVFANQGADPVWIGTERLDPHTALWHWGFLPRDQAEELVFMRDPNLVVSVEEVHESTESHGTVTDSDASGNSGDQATQAQSRAKRRQLRHA